MYGVRGSIRIEPAPGTTIDIMAQYFHEKDSRMRIQKQMCQRDPTGVLGCLNGKRKFEMTNANTTFVGVLTAGNSSPRRVFQPLRTGQPLWHDQYSRCPVYGNRCLCLVRCATNPADMRTVNTDLPRPTTPRNGSFRAVSNRIWAAVCS
jgi:iron complex outermembrane receptor protein